MTAQEFWEMEQQVGHGFSDSEFQAMNSWTFGQFRLTMKFAEAYALQKERQREKESMASTR